MSKHLLVKISFVWLLLLTSFSFAQRLPNDIDAFRKADSISFPGTGKILFVGSSSFTKWKDVQQYFPAYPIINRGFGGSLLTDVIRWEDYVIFPYEPKQIVIYCGENDVASSDSVTAAVVLTRFKILFNDIRAKMPDVPIVFVSLKPSPSREKLWPTMVASNKAIKKFLRKKKENSFR